jgi:hypothetical protein
MLSRKEVEKEMILSDSQEMAMLEIGEPEETLGYIPQRILNGLLARDLIYEHGPGLVDFTTTGKIVYKALVASGGGPGSEMDVEPITYRVVGVNGDRTRVILDEGLTKQRAQQMRRLLLGANTFPRVAIDPE